MTISRLLRCGLIALIAVSAHAAVVFDNPWSTQGGNCIYSTTCAASVGAGDVYAAQLFSLSSAEVLTAASVTNWLTPGLVEPSALNWMFLTVNGSTGLPDVLLFSGSGAPVTGRTFLGSMYGYDIVRADFNLPSVGLGPGSYYFAVQAISGTFETYLSSGTLPSGAADTHDGGTSWTLTYEDYSSIAVSLSNSSAAIPEPASWAMLLTGLGALGCALRRRR